MGYEQYLSSRTFVPLYLEGEREIDQVEKEVKLNAEDKYCRRPNTPEFEKLSLFEFYQNYDVEDRDGLIPERRNKEAIPVVMRLRKVSRDSPDFVN